MISTSIINRIIILGFMVLVGWCLARAIYFGNVMGVILALVSLAASIVFVYLLTKWRAELRSDTTTDSR